MDADRAILAKYDPFSEKIDHALADLLSSRIAFIEKIGSHSLLGGGKRLRPLLFILSCHLCGYAHESLYRISTIFEYIHTASLLHDDVLDNARTRRRKPSANHLWGNHAAVLEGDFLYSKSFCVAVEADSLAFLKLITDTTLQMAEGQILELLHTNDWSLDKKAYLDIIHAKTAVLISAACASGGIISCAHEGAVESLAQFGRNMGMAFQIMDDLLDYASTETVFGKPVGKDIREGRVTLPLIYTLAQLPPSERARICTLFERDRPSEKDYCDIVERIRGNDVLERVRCDAQRYVDRAADCLDLFPDSQDKRNLLELNQFIVERQY